MTRIATTLVALLALFVIPAVTNAAVFIPTGLNPGDMYQLLFVTQGTIAATSPDISTYNSFVQTQAALNPVLTGTGMGINWFAIASTVNNGDANANALSLADDVFLLDGTQIASGVKPLYSGTGLLSSPNIDQFATAKTSFVWTGSSFTGTTAGPLGSSPATVGFSNTSILFWLSDPIRQSSSMTYPVFALSEKLTVPQAGGGVVPEPSSALVWLLLGVGSFSFSYCRSRRNTNRCQRAIA